MWLWNKWLLIKPSFSPRFTCVHGSKVWVRYWLQATLPWRAFSLSAHSLIPWILARAFIDARVFLGSGTSFFVGFQPAFPCLGSMKIAYEVFCLWNSFIKVYYGLNYIHGFPQLFSLMSFVSRILLLHTKSMLWFSGLFIYHCSI